MCLCCVAASHRDKRVTLTARVGGVFSKFFFGIPFAELGEFVRDISVSFVILSWAGGHTRGFIPMRTALARSLRRTRCNARPPVPCMIDQSFSAFLPSWNCHLPPCIRIREAEYSFFI
jgi:hypothetical protein